MSGWGRGRGWGWVRGWGRGRGWCLGRGWFQIRGWGRGLSDRWKVRVRSEVADGAGFGNKVKKRRRLFDVMENAYYLNPEEKTYVLFSERPLSHCCISCQNSISIARFESSNFDLLSSVIFLPRRLLNCWMLLMLIYGKVPLAWSICACNFPSVSTPRKN